MFKTKKVTSNTYGEFDLAGVQIRQTGKNKGIRFVTSVSERLISELKKLGGKVEYGYVTGVKNNISTSTEDVQIGTKGAVAVDCTSLKGKDHKNFEN